MKEAKGWKLSDESNTVVTKHFNEATTDDMKSYIQPAISNNPEFIVLHWGTNDFWQIGKSLMQLKLGKRF